MSKSTDLANSVNPGSIGGARLVNDAVSTGKIANLAVTNVEAGTTGKLSGFWDWIAVNDPSAGPLSQFTNVSASNEVSGAILSTGGYVSFTPSSAPVSPRPARCTTTAARTS